jgi:hypothetical protein
MKQKAVVVTKFNKEHPEDAVKVVEKDVPKPEPGASHSRGIVQL